MSSQEFFAKAKASIDAERNEAVSKVHDEEQEALRKRVPLYIEQIGNDISTIKAIMIFWGVIVPVLAVLYFIFSHH